jgi:hypothetical protein
MALACSFQITDGVRHTNTHSTAKGGWVIWQCTCDWNGFAIRLRNSSVLLVWRRAKAIRRALQHGLLGSIKRVDGVDALKTGRAIRDELLCFALDRFFQWCWGCGDPVPV